MNWALVQQDGHQGLSKSLRQGTESGTYGSYIEIVLEKAAEERAEEGQILLKQDENGDDIFIRTDFAGQPDDNVIIEGIASQPTDLDGLDLPSLQRQET